MILLLGQTTDAESPYRLSNEHSENIRICQYVYRWVEVPRIPICVKGKISFLLPKDLKAAFNMYRNGFYYCALSYGKPSDLKKK